MVALLLFLGSAAPVIAESAPPSPDEARSAIPSSEEITAALRVAEAEHEKQEAAFEEELATPQAEHEREASRTAYVGLQGAEAKSLLFETFNGQLGELNEDPGRLLSGLKVTETLSDNAALIEEASREKAILQSSAPVDGAASEAPVDLELEKAGLTYVPENPLTEVRLPASADHAIELEGGVEVRLPARNDHAAEAAGAMNLFYPGTEAATDTLVAPRADGVEVFEQLRSPESPERFHFELALPPGASLRAKPDGGAEVVSGSGGQLEEVLPPSAVDAQGVRVPVAMTVEGSSLLLEVPHRSRELAYPLLLDPNFVNDTTSFGEWIPSESTAGVEYPLTNLGSSLRALSKGNYYTYPANTNGQWVYVAHGETAYIAAATFSSVYFLDNNCQTWEPHGYVGIYNVATGRYDNVGEYRNGKIENSSFQTGWVGTTSTRDAMIGIGTGGSSSSLACAHELYVGGYTIQEKDPYPPSITSVSGIPSGWFDPQKAGNVTVNVTDTGLGVHEVSTYDGYETTRHPLGCTGANGSRCPREVSWASPAPWVAGERTFEVFAEDPVENSAPAWTTTTKVDN